jgi:SAM-dependent methyltransferase
MNNLTDKEYWDCGYKSLTGKNELPDLDDFRWLPDKRIVDLLEGVGLDGKDILEVGAGNSTLLLLLATRHHSGSKFVGLDYSEAGCAALRAGATKCRADISVIQGDMFSPPEGLYRRFDVLYSMGVVEHFLNLANVLRDLKKYLKPGGVMVTVIPNMAGVLGTLTKRFNLAIYDIHNPHDLESLVSGHIEAGFRPIRSGYLCSTNFGVLSACFPARHGVSFQFYRVLLALSLGSWIFESKLFEFPKTAALSPYLYVVGSA